MIVYKSRVDNEYIDILLTNSVAWFFPWLSKITTVLPVIGPVIVVLLIINIYKFEVILTEYNADLSMESFESVLNAGIP